MLKLKIGQNYLLVNYERTRKILPIILPYMMSCFDGENKIALCVDLENGFEYFDDVVKELNDGNVNELYFLTYMYMPMGKIPMKKQIKKDAIFFSKNGIKDIILRLKAKRPNMAIKVISINNYVKLPEYKVANNLMTQLLQDNDSILSVIKDLDIYKYMSKRYTHIPNEIKVIDNDIKKMNQNKEISQRIVTLKTIEYLNLIQKAELDGQNLVLEIKPIPINPSEPLGLVFEPDAFKTNPYLFKAASYIYQGCHFGAMPTKISIDNRFRLRFLETLDHRFDKMFQFHNWSRVGYPHFGNGGFCAGEFNDAMAHGAEYGLDYYFIALKQYLTTANMRDTAGYRVWWYPIYNENGEMVYCAGVDVLINEVIRYRDPDVYRALMTMSWEDKTKLCERFEYNENVLSRYSCHSLSYHYNGKEDAFLKVCEQVNPELYKQIKERRIA